MRVSLRGVNHVLMVLVISNVPAVGKTVVENGTISGHVCLD